MALQMFDMVLNMTVPGERFTKTLKNLKLNFLKND